MKNHTEQENCVDTSSFDPSIFRPTVEAYVTAVFGSIFLHGREVQQMIDETAKRIALDPARMDDALRGLVRSIKVARKTWEKDSIPQAEPKRWSLRWECWTNSQKVATYVTTGVGIVGAIGYAAYAYYYSALKGDQPQS